MATRFGIGFLVLLTTAVVAWQYADAQDQPKSDQFQQKFVLATFGANAELAVLEDPRIGRLGRREFLVGRWAGGSGPLPVVKGSNIWIPMKKIEQISEYESLDRIREFIRID